MHNTNPWPPEQEAELIRLHGMRLSSGKMATALGLTRNSIIGKCRRMNLALSRMVTVRRVKAVRQVRVPRPVIWPQPRPVYVKPKPQWVSAPTCEPVTLLDRTVHQCCWPVGDGVGRDLRMCGAPAHSRMVNGEMRLHSYCEFHFGLSTSKPGKEWTPEQRARFLRARSRPVLVR